MVRKVKISENQLIVDAVIDSMKSKKAKEITVIDFRQMHHSVCDFFVICQAANSPQAEAIIDAVVYNLRFTPGIHPIGVEGRQNAEWILLDYASVVVHVFQEKAHQFYRLEELWSDALVSTISESE
ncbi:MAG: ribosome silencing factor [Bacteroidales bacterium]|jgi:ribosome-associated protein|nr:ribosome silencing factor [Bacteroidales bacterium]MDD3664788.1 ribosome silencing factor [Bacteroidales bacterium]